MKTKCSQPGHHLTEDADAQFETLNSFLVHPNEPSDAAQVKMSNYDTNLLEPSLSMTTNSGSQQTKNTHNVSVATTRYHALSRPHLNKLRRQKSPAPESPESPTPANRSQINIFRSSVYQILPPRPTLIYCRTPIWSYKNYKGLHYQPTEKCTPK